MDFKLVILKSYKYSVLIFWLILTISIAGQAQIAGEPDVLPGIALEGNLSVSENLVEKVKPFTKIRRIGWIGLHNKELYLLENSKLGRLNQKTVSFEPQAKNDASFQNVTFHPIRSDIIFTLKDDSGRDKTQLYRINLTTGEETMLSDPAETEIVRGITFVPNENTLYYTGYVIKGNQGRLVKVNFETGERQIAAEYKGTRTVGEISADGKKLLLDDYRGAGDTVLYLFNPDSGKSSAFTSEAAKLANWDARFLHKGNALLWLSTADSDTGDAYIKAVSDETPQRLGLPQDGDLSSVTISPNNKMIAVKYNQNGSNKIRLFKLNNFTLGKELSMPKTPSGVISTVLWTGNEELTFNTETGKAAGIIFRYQIPKNKLTSLYQTLEASAKIKELPDAEIVSWKSFDNQEITGILHRPLKRAAAGKSPVLIDIHGGPQLQARPRYNGRNNYLTTELGFAVVFPNVRGSSGFSESFLGLDDGAKRGDAVKDLESLLDWISKQPDLDSNNVFVKGDSYGAFLALALGKAQAARLRGVIAGSPIIDIPAYVEKFPREAQKSLRAEYGDVDDPKLRSALDNLSPVKTPAEWTLPLLLSVGKKDTRIPVENVASFYEQLKDRNQPVYLLTAADEGHVWGDAAFNYRFYLMTVFLSKYAGSPASSAKTVK